jgi:hypothetical protein
MAIDILSIAPMSDKAERVFSKLADKQASKQYTLLLA